MKSGNWLTFFGTCNANKVLPINPLRPIIHGLYFLSDVFFNQVYTRAVNPPPPFPCLQVLKIDGKGTITDVVMTTADDIICEKKKTARKRFCWSFNI